jgi:hypothetical protein
VADVTGPASYTTGGFTLQALQFGLSYFDYVGFAVSVSGTYMALFTPAAALSKPTGQLTIYTLGAGEVPALTNLSAEHFVIYAIGL